MVLLSTGRRQLTVYHEGHGVTQAATLADAMYADAKVLVSRLLETSDVLYVDMPLLGLNSHQKLRIGNTEVSAHGHEWFALHDSQKETALRYFLAPIRAALDEVGPFYDTIDMIGRSGGGWATTVYSALDPRISVSISIAGTAPIHVRGPDVDGRDDIGDWEQYGAMLYRQIGYEDLYALAALEEGRRHVQIYLEHDNCCFSGAKGRAAEAAYVAQYDGLFPVSFVVLDETDHYSMPIDSILTILNSNRALAIR